MSGQTLESQVAAFIGPFEAEGGPVLTSYLDVAGVWTIGYGTTRYEVNGTDLPVTEGLTWTAEQCLEALANDVVDTVAFVVAVNMHHPWSTNQILVLCSLAYNIGQTAFKSSTVLHEHNMGNLEEAAQAFLLWDKAHVDGQLVEVPGLFSRRKAESAKYLT